MDFNLRNVVLVLACLAIYLGGIWLFEVNIPQASWVLKLVFAVVLGAISLTPLLVTDTV